VYEFLADPENWNQWAHGLGKSIRRSQNRWIADNQEGTIEVRFTPKNTFGVVDHYVRRKSGQEIYVPMRVIANGSGSELLFTGASEWNPAGALPFVGVFSDHHLSTLRSVAPGVMRIGYPPVKNSWRGLFLSKEDRVA